MKLRAALLTACLLLLAATPQAFADGIDFSSSIFSGYVKFSGTGTAVGSHIPITTLSGGGQSVGVTGSSCPVYGSSAVACGYLNFTTGSVLSAGSGQDIFASGGTLKILGIIPGMSTVSVLLTATFTSNVTVTQTSSDPFGGTLVLTGAIEVTSLAPAVMSTFGITTVPLPGNNMTEIIIRTAMGSNGSFNGKAESQGLTTTPEPPSMLLLGTGMLGLAGLLRRKLT